MTPSPFSPTGVMRGRAAGEGNTDLQPFPCSPCARGSIMEAERAAGASAPLPGWEWGAAGHPAGRGNSEQRGHSEGSPGLLGMGRQSGSKPLCGTVTGEGSVTVWL